MSTSGLYLFLLKILVDTFFSTNDINNVASEFAPNDNHYYRIVANFILTIAAIYFNKSSWSVYKNKYIMILFFYYSYAALSSIWSSNWLVSLGNSFYAFEFIILGLFVTSSSLANPNSYIQIRSFVRQWSIIILFTYFSSMIVYPDDLPFTALDEKALSALLRAYLFNILRTDRLCKYMLLSLALLGKSVTSIVCGFIFIALNLLKENIRLSFVLVVSFLVGGVLAYDELVNDNITIYGKNINHFLTGSGRFMVWESLAEAFSASDSLYKIFGHGFMTERAALVQSDLPWVIDVHNNLLQVLYGTGFIGLSIVCVAFVYPFFANCNTPFITNRIIINTNIILFMFGFSSSTFISRPSFSLAFFSSLMLLTATYEKRKKNQIVS